MRRLKFTVAVGLTVALGVAALAYADGVSENTAFVDGSIKPKKLDPKKRTPIALFSGVRTETDSVDGTAANPGGRADRVRRRRQVEVDRGAVLHREHRDPRPDRRAGA